MTASVVDVRQQGGIAAALPVVGPLVALSALGWISLAASPWLMAYPLLLIALNPRMLFLLVVAPRVGLLEFTLIATARLCLADPFSYLLGVRYGSKVRGKLEGSRLRAWLLRVSPVERTACAGAIWLRPNQTVLAWAGSLRLSPKYVAFADVMTTVAYVVLIHQGMSFF